MSPLVARGRARLLRLPPSSRENSMTEPPMDSLLGRAPKGFMGQWVCRVATPRGRASVAREGEKCTEDVGVLMPLDAAARPSLVHLATTTWVKGHIHAKTRVGDRKQGMVWMLGPHTMPRRHMPPH
jgi:hypothetical protein